MTRFQSIAAMFAVVVMAPVSAFAQFPFASGFGNCPNGQCARPTNIYGVPTYSVAPGGCVNGQCNLPNSVGTYQSNTPTTVTQTNYTNVPSPYFTPGTNNSVDLTLSPAPMFNSYVNQQPYSHQSTVPNYSNTITSQPPSTIPQYAPQYNNYLGANPVAPQYRDRNFANGQCSGGQCANGQCQNCNCVNCGPDCNCVNGQCINCDGNQNRGFRHHTGRPVSPYTQDRNILPANYNFPVQYRLNTGYTNPAGQQSAGLKSL